MKPALRNFMVVVTSMVALLTIASFFIPDMLKSIGLLGLITVVAFCFVVGLLYTFISNKRQDTKQIRQSADIPSMVGDFKTITDLFNDQNIRVTLVSNSITGEKLVLKTYQTEHATPSLIPQLNNAKILQPIKTWVTGDTVYELTKYVDSWTLAEIIKYAKHRPTITGALLETWISKLLELLDCLHSNRPVIIHGDINPYNVLVRKDNLDLYLIDFTSAKLSDGQSDRHVYGLPGFIDPLRVKGERLLSSDLYSLGCVIYFMNTGQIPPNASDRIHYNASMALIDARIGRRYRSIYEKFIALTKSDRFASAREALNVLKAPSTTTKRLSNEFNRLILPDKRIVRIYDFLWDFEK